MLRVSGRLTVQAASILLALSLVLPVLILGWSQPFRETDLTTVVLSGAGTAANVLPAAMKGSPATEMMTSGSFFPADLFRQHANGNVTNNTLMTAVGELLKEATEDTFLHNFVVTTVMLGMSNGDSLEATNLQGAIAKNRLIVSRIPTSDKTCKVITGDARNLPLPDDSTNLVVTSPPYINVFNYHQNYRKAMELLGWQPLEVARAELGSNRKHRGNRFMTVVQYCMDLAQVFAELKRVLVADGVVVFVVGRESRVRDVPFHNGHLLALTAIGEGSFRLERWQERKFTNRFGESIYEDLITFVPNGQKTVRLSVEFGRMVGVKALTYALGRSKGEVRRDVEQAIERAGVIHPSPLFG